MLNIFFTNDTMMALEGQEIKTKQTEILTNLDRLYSLQATGEELDWIRCHFKNLPVRCDLSSVFWFGDLAKFIIANW